MEISSNETIKQAVIAGLGIAFISGHTIAAEIEDKRLVVLDIVGLPEIRQWFVVRPAAKRLMPAARVLRDFLVAEGQGFLPALPGVRPRAMQTKTSRKVRGSRAPKRRRQT
jgi:LysR family transcriptional regulator for metE and metH